MVGKKILRIVLILFLIGLALCFFRIHWGATWMKTWLHLWFGNGNEGFVPAMVIR